MQQAGTGQRAHPCHRCRRCRHCRCSLAAAPPVSSAPHTNALSPLPPIPSHQAFSAAAAPARQHRCRALAVSAAAAGAPATDFRQRAPADVRVLVVGATGYIGKFVVKELVKRGYNVVAFARERSGIGGKQGAEDVRAEFLGAGALLRTSAALSGACCPVLLCACGVADGCC